MKMPGISCSGSPARRPSWQRPARRRSSPTVPQAAGLAVATTGFGLVHSSLLSRLVYRTDGERVKPPRPGRVPDTAAPSSADVRPLVATHARMLVTATAWGDHLLP